MSLLDELNKIANEEMKPQWYWICMFCGKKSSNGKWMFKHIVGHLRRCMPVCEGCGEQHIPNYFNDYDETLDAHTITVALEDTYRGKRFLGFRGS